MIRAFEIEIEVDLIRGERSMLKLLSRFVLEVLPYVLTALIAAIVVPGFLSSQLHGSQPSGALNGAERAVGVSNWCATTTLAMRESNCITS